MWLAHAFRNHFLAQHALVLVQLARVVQLPGGFPHDFTLRRVVALSSLRFHGLWLLWRNLPLNARHPTQHGVSCPKRARGCAELGWTSGSQLTQFTVHSSQFTRRRLFPVVYLTNLANVAPAGTSRRRRPRLLLVGATQGPPLQSMVQQQDVLSCLSAERPPNTTATDVLAFGTSQGPSPQPIVQ